MKYRLIDSDSNQKTDHLRAKQINAGKIKLSQAPKFKIIFCSTRKFTSFSIENPSMCTSQYRLLC